MATVTLNPLYTGLKGRLGGIIFYSRYNMLCARSVVKPHNPNTPAQRSNRCKFSFHSPVENPAAVLYLYNVQLI